MAKPISQLDALCPTPEEAKELTTIQPLSIQEEYTRMPGDLAYWNGQFSRAFGEHLRAKAVREKVEAEAQIRERTAAEGAAKRVTEGYIESLVTVNSSYQTAVQAEIEAEITKSKIAGLVDAIRAKKDMLVSLGADLRQELQGPPVIRKPERKNP